MPDEILKNILASNEKYIGLTSEQAKIAKENYGLNIRPTGKRKTWFDSFWGIISEPMILLLLTTAAVYFFIGDKTEAIILLVSIVPILIIEFIQEQRTDEAIKALDKLMIEFCEVYRDGKIQKIEAKNIFPGDLIYVTAGDKVPADGYLLNSFGLLVDEAMLTGESVAAQKSAIDKHTELKDESKLFQGTMIVQGEGTFVVSATGGHTAYGKLGNLLEKIEQIDTPLQRKIHVLVKTVAIIALIISALVGIIITYHFGWTQGLLSSLSIMMSLIPEEFPIVFSVFLIMGVWRMTKHNALTREMAMVETLGSATVICTDKTGTLTEGKMSLEQIYYQGKFFSTKEIKENTVDFFPLVKTSLLSLEQIAIDPMEIEIQNFAGKIGIDIDTFFREHTLLQDLPFESKNKMVHHLWKDKKNSCIQYSAGAPEFIIKNSSLSEVEKIQATSAYESMAENGYRIIAVAKRNCASDETILVENLEFVGLLAMSDPPREGVKEAIDICQKAGIRVIMITGDNKLTAHNIAENIGLKHNEDIVVGTDLENLSENALQETVRRHDIFTRVKPEQKFAIVSALQNMGEIVAMTGDGVNDAPALKKANIGIAMGQKGTEVARAAAGIVLLDDNFSTIVKSISEGRHIYDNLRQAFVFLFSFHLPIVGLAILPLLFGQSLAFYPINIIFLELFCDPVAVLGFEREKARKNLMTDKPRPANEPLINLELLNKILVQGFSILAVSFGFYYYFAIYMGQTEIGRTMSFASLVMSQTILILVSREWEQIKSNTLLLAISLLTIFILALIIFIPALHSIFHFETLNLNQIILLCIVPLISMITTTLITKKFNHR